MKSFQRPTQHADSKHLFFQRPVVRSTKETCHIFGIQESHNTFKGLHEYSFKASR
ncbi:MULTISPECIES: hypothetical protein [Maribacter]|uniref:Uncharacterized protein n=1 Tax=Maribacter flavus TaxID=1658664 RepID=A0ABU7IEC3_9FLAO|nr:MULTISPECIES: hypothetical protein [Maribacter]MDC6403932.1 hypothetical protein [Maribacter sp. PR66]MEE1971073.1 hypothetical protein [Maribacter flavus]